jgi:agmatinase
MSTNPEGSFDPAGPSAFDGVFGLPTSHAEANVVLIPVPWEATTSYRRGTATGPANIRERSHQVDLFDRDFGRIYETGVFMHDADPAIVALNEKACELSLPIIEAGGASTPELEVALEQVNAMSRELNERVLELAERELSLGKRVALVGGDHSTPFGLIQALLKRHPRLGILHIDAHADLRNAYEGFEHSHASIMFNVHEQLPVERIVQVGIRDFSEEEANLAKNSPRITSFYDGDLADRIFNGESWHALTSEIVRALPETVYISFDIDGLQPDLCANTGTPVPGGLGFREAVYLLRAVAKERTIVGFDLNEVNGAAEWDGIVGARLLYKLIGCMIANTK